MGKVKEIGLFTSLWLTLWLWRCHSMILTQGHRLPVKIRYWTRTVTWKEGIRSRLWVFKGHRRSTTSLSDAAAGAAGAVDLELGTYVTLRDGKQGTIVKKGRGVTFTLQLQGSDEVC